ncbi:Aldo/keto reductase [Leucogyrophana mollusca]|uniref:Aldo/keto reductase n=1 Tax=Leucogyrophana mollusca TaxID=85980 RepID=A0ACB8B7N7_9AGAM|nr:Aldo/keto reductase [Leucogyrophana mollusca]
MHLIILSDSLPHPPLPTAMSTRIPLLLGTPAFGVKGPKATARINTIKEAQDIVDLLVSYGQKGLDTSRCYGNGSSEEFIGQLDLKGAFVDTGAYPFNPGDFGPEKLRESVELSVKALGPHKIHTFFLQGPERATPIEVTLRTINELYKEGHFEEFGVSNYFAWEVAEMVAIAEKNNWIRPTVYQGLYNAIERRVEDELFPCLRHFGIRFNVYSPLASGVLTGKFPTETEMRSVTGTRWDPKISEFATSLHSKYGPLLPVVRELKDVLDKHDIRITEAAQRWLQHHSQLRPECGDMVVIGASNIKQVEANLKESTGGPLPEDALGLLEKAWSQAKGLAPHYAF